MNTLGETEKIRFSAKSIIAVPTPEPRTSGETQIL